MSTVEVERPPEVVGGRRDPAPAGQKGTRAVAQSLLSRVVIQGLNAATGILTARALLPTGRGELAAMILWAQFLASMTSLGVPSSLIYSYRNWPEEREEIVGTGLWIGLITGMVAAVVGAIFLPHWMRQYPAPVVRAAQWFLLTTPICSLTFAGKSILEGAGKFSSSNALQVMTPLATLIPLLGLAAFHALTPFTAALAYVGSALPSFLFLCYRLRPLMGRLAASWRTGKLLLHYGLRSYGIDILGSLAFQVDQVLVVRLLSASEMGSYVVVLSLSRMLNLFQNSVVMVLFPKAAGRPAEAVLVLTERAARVSAVVTSCFALFVYVFGPGLLNLLYGKEYASALSCLGILLVEVTMAGCVYVLSQAFMALGRPGIVTLLQAIGLSLSVPLMLLLIPRWGIRGAAMSLLASTIMRFVLVFAAFRYFLGTRLPDMKPRISDFRSLYASFRLRQERMAA